MKPYLVTFSSVVALQCSLYLPTFTMLFEADPMLFWLVALPLIIGVGIAAGLLGWGVYKIVSKICSIIAERNERPIRPEEQ